MNLDSLQVIAKTTTNNDGSSMATISVAAEYTTGGVKVQMSADVQAPSISDVAVLNAIHTVIGSL